MATKKMSPERGETLTLAEALEEGWTIERLEEEYILTTLERVGWRKAAAARRLGIDRRTLYRKLMRYEWRGARPGREPGTSQ